MYSKSETFQFLTKYAEGILLARIQKSKKYFIRQQTITLWYVMYDSNNANDSQSDIFPRYKRVREVSISRYRNCDIMTCSCGSPQRWLLPCQHCIAVLNSVDSVVVLPNIHLRWWKHFSYYLHENDSLTDSTFKELMTEVQSIHKSLICPNRKSWLGFPLDRNQVVSLSLKLFTEVRDEIYKEMIEVLDHTVLHGPMVISTSNYHNEDLETGVIVEDDQISNSKISDIDEENELEVTKHLSQHRTDLLNKEVTTFDPNDDMDVKNKFIQLWNLVKEKITSNNDFLNIRSMLESYKSRQRKEYRDRFSSLWWMVERKINNEKDFENLEHLLDLFKSEEDLECDPSILNSTIDKTKGVKRKKYGFEK